MAGVVLRPAEATDRAAVNALFRYHGFKTRSEAGWRWLFGPRPWRAEPVGPAGWVLEQDGQLRGYVGNHVLDYVHGGQDLVVATCSALYVHPSARAGSTALFRAWLRQPGVALFMSTTANEASRGVYTLFGARSPADECFTEGYAWLADEGDLLGEVLGRMGAPPAQGEPAGHLLAPLARLARRAVDVRRPRVAAFDGEIRAVAPHEVGAEFDRLGERLRASGALQVRRDAAALRWYLADPDAPGSPCVLGAFDARGLAGYAMARLHRAPMRRVTELRVLDFVFRPGSADAVGPLLARLVGHARQAGAGLVYCPPCGPQLATVLRAHRPYVNRLVHPRHYLRAMRAGLQDELARPGAWHATGLDGDAAFGLAG